MTDCGVLLLYLRSAGGGYKCQGPSTADQSQIQLRDIQARRGYGLTFRLS